MKGIKRTIRTFVLACAAVAGTALLSGCGFKEQAQPYKVNLEVWGVFDDSDAYTQLMAEYRKMNPYIGDISYRKFTPDTYKQDLLDALASGKGPDVFMIRNSWLPAFADKVAAAPDYISDERAYRNAFVDVVASDFFGQDGKIYGAPLSVDSLALYYNKDLLNAAGIVAPPATWEELVDDVQRLSRIDSFGNIVQSGIALGTARTADDRESINRSTDILTAMMMQKGVPFWNSLNNEVSLTNGGEGVLDFYTRFASVSSPMYTWNLDQHYSIDAFYETKTAMMINYSWQYNTIKRKNAKLNFAVAPLPHFAGGAPANYANYWSFVVAKNKVYGNEVQNAAQADKLRVHEAWQFLKYLTFPHPDQKLTLRNGLTGNTKDFSLALDPAKLYLEKTQKPAARRDLVEEQKKDVFLGPFADGNLNAKNWPQTDPEAIEGVLADMIRSVNLGQNTVYGALDVAQTRINRIMRGR
jgi:ABC-type glycerol-3-phosphate transport system substrate-binding protein